MSKPDTNHVKKLILEAPIGEYLGEKGAQVLAEHTCCEGQLKDSEFLFHQGDLESSFYIITEGRLALVKGNYSAQYSIIK